MLSPASIPPSIEADTQGQDQERVTENGWPLRDLNDLDPRALSFVLAIVESLVAGGHVDEASAVMAEIQPERLCPTHRQRLGRTMEAAQIRSRSRPVF